MPGVNLQITSSQRSALTKHIDQNRDTTHDGHFTALALTIQQNLTYQHGWKQVCFHSHSPREPHALLSRPLLSGIPPERVYIHPDEQVEMLKEEKESKILAKSSEVDPDTPKAKPEPVKILEREWVLPTHLREKWSLRKFAESFDAVDEEPPEDGGTEDSPKYAKTASAEGDIDKKGIEVRRGKRRGGKRMLLATLNDDSTVVYYVVHEGIVKPRQN